MAEDIAQWLDRIGLGQYTAVFAENDIEPDILADLTDADLEKLGVSLGHRKRLLRAIAALSADLPTIDPARQPERHSAEAERRQLTVLFCDLVGSTALSYRLDPEDMREVMRNYQDTVAGVVTRYKGYVAKYMGDGVLAYFGYPRAFENDSERAIHVGLELVEVVKGIAAPGGDPLAIRVGIATGDVVVGDIVGEGSAQEAAITGEAPNLAARLQDIAAPNTVVIGAATHTLAGALFETAALPRQTFKGFPDPVPAWSVARPQRSESRFQAIRGETLTELIGRDEEMGILLRRWEQAISGEGQVVLISGEPGIGKSRLVHEIRAQVAGAGAYTRTWQCSPHHTTSALFPFVEQAAVAIGLAPQDTNEEKLEKLEEWIGIAGQAPEDIAPIFGPFLSIDASVRYPSPSASPQRQKEILLNGFAKRFDGLSAKGTFLLIAEDAHWIDPTSLELVNRHVEQARKARCLIIVTYRPEFAAPWVGEAHTTLIALKRLDRLRCAEFAAKVSGGARLSESVVGQIVERTDGVPLFVEELTKSVIEDTAGSSGAIISVPSTLRDSLEARIDRLGDAKQLVQSAAVIGREFSYALLSALVPDEQRAFDARLARLTGSGLVFQRGEPPEATYTFKHALVQDTAYGSLLRERREELHRRVANALVERLPEVATSSPELLAHHFTEGRVAHSAVENWLIAGRTAMKRWATSEAIANLKKGLSLIGQVDDPEVRTRYEIDYQLDLGVAHRYARGSGQEEA